MKKSKELQTIIEEPVYYMDYKQKELERRLSGINLSHEAEKEIKLDHAKEAAKTKALALMGTFGEVISTFLDWNDGVNEDIKEAKKSILLATYMDKVDDHQFSLDKLKKFLVDPSGNTLFNKILRILDDSPPDGELIEHLSSSLKFIIESENFDTLFDIHKFSLSQIERLSPQSLSVLADYKNWPLFSKFEAFQQGNTVKEDFHAELAQVYCSGKCIENEAIERRVAYSIFELRRAQFIEAYRTNGGMVRARLTLSGKDIVHYLNTNEQES